VWQVGDSVEQNDTFKVEIKMAKADKVTDNILAGLPATLERSNIVSIVNVTWQKTFTRVETNKKSTNARGWGPLNCILLDHPELQETNDRVKSVTQIYEKQVKDGIYITNLSTLNTYQGSMGLCMDMFLEHKVKEMALGKMTPTEKKEKRRLTGQKKKDRGKRVSAGLVVITN
jgi:hypothetical protein